MRSRLLMLVVPIGAAALFMLIQLPPIGGTARQLRVAADESLKDSPSGALPPPPRADWNEVPAYIAFNVPGFFTRPSDVQSSKTTRSSWAGWVGSISTDLEYGAPLEEMDLAMRSVGLVSGIDFQLLSLAGANPTKQDYAESYYLPLVLGACQYSAISDREVVQRLIELSSKPESVFASLPVQLRGPNTALGIPVRAALLLSDIPGSGISEHLRATFASSTSIDLKLAAAGALIQRGEGGPLKDWLIQQLSDHTQRAKTLAILGNCHVRAYVTEKPWHSAPFHIAYSENARFLDGAILRIFEGDPDPITLKAAIRVLSTRHDNARIRESLGEMLKGTNDGNIAVAILKGGMNLWGSPSFEEGVRRWISSANRRAKLWALQVSTWLALSDHFELIAASINGEDPIAKGLAVFSLTWNGASNPVKALDLVAQSENSGAPHKSVDFNRRMVRKKMQMLQGNSGYAQLERTKLLDQGYISATR